MLEIYPCVLFVKVNLDVNNWWMDRWMDEVVRSWKLRKIKCPPVQLQQGTDFFWDLNLCVCPCGFRIQSASLVQHSAVLLIKYYNLWFKLWAGVCLESMDNLNAAFSFREQDHPSLGLPDVSFCLCLCAYTVGEVRKKRSAYLTIFSYILFILQSYILKYLALQSYEASCF